MNKVMVKIHGAEYPMVGDKSEKFMISIADFVDKEMDKITRQNPKLSLSVAAILTALNISDLLFECSDENERLIKANEELSKKVGSSNEELQLEIKSLKLTIAEKEAENRETEAKMKELIEIIENKKQEIFELSNTTEGSKAELDAYKNKIEELTAQLEESNERATIAENLASEFQNKAYDLQLKCTGLNNDVKNVE
ncbi:MULTISPECIES: cell division protein ZapA [unclassified Clostridioides]|uniref:cell division protein ZapA n=1 Tax=unclassified Clostridioides TaxID=2635829 RepID=UPI001D0C6B74|nr:cell division protein ZapA [Clostridioides sp. ES-S-0001-02]MCC0640821.1 cell division protein ZapA [Clostridioides sp. ES-S-0049-03]MCC0646748.1 cell division protein ZapA [Clostridioides sp. ZZV15-6598]MCC0653363.1 cell division protein ZapA [Clostridioides sp. ES-S-0001-03]MCC0656628.1 cell division protein ZapA [Clostridioides sp. ES-S-0123-01]MCC0672019.1 cell division protein ZapA [Clostridioides sp. ES-S-0145-01]MCC0676009.1 cell division protein ZapA [Clostridioides sp. ES-W-0018-0